MRMLDPILKTVPAVMLTTVEAKAHLVVEHDEDDAIIDGFVAAASARLEGRDGILNHAFVTQTWLVSFDSLPANVCFRLPLGPVQAINSIKYFDALDAEATIDPATYRFHQDSIGPYVKLKDGESWPTDLSIRDDAVTVDYDAGYGDADAIPLPIMQAAKLMLSDWYEHRGSIVVGTVAAKLPMPGAVRHLINPYDRKGK